MNFHQTPRGEADNATALEEDQPINKISGTMKQLSLVHLRRAAQKFTTFNRDQLQDSMRVINSQQRIRKRVKGVLALNKDQPQNRILGMMQNQYYNPNERSSPRSPSLE